MHLPSTSYDRRAIMADAIAQARAMRTGMALSWREALSLALRTAWAMARRRPENLLAVARSASKPARIPARNLLLTYRHEDGETTARTVRLGSPGARLHPGYGSARTPSRSDVEPSTALKAIRTAWFHG